MQRKQQEIRRPLSGKPYQTSPAQFFPIENRQIRPVYQSRLIDNQRVMPIPFNQISAINITSSPAQIVKHYNPMIKTTSHLKVYPNTKKVYFTYFHPDNLVIEKRYIETIPYREQKPYTNEWEQRYFELQKQMIIFMQSHEKMTEQFIKIKQELKIHTELSFQNTLQNFKTQSLMNTHNQREQNFDLIQKYDKLKLDFQQVERDATAFKEQNFRLQHMLQNLQTQLIRKINIQNQKNQYYLQAKQYQLNIKQLSNDRSKLQTQIYDLKLVLASKNLQIQQLLLQKSQTKKVDQNKTDREESMTKQKFQQRLTRIRAQYQKKERKMEKLLQSHNKQTSQLRKLILQLEQRQKACKELKQRYEKLYNQKKQQVINLKKIQQNLLSANTDQRQIVYYEQKIAELTNIAKQQAQKIKQLEKIKKQLNKKIQQYQDNYVSQQQLQVLHSAIQKNKNHILEKGGVNYDQLNNKANPYFNGKIFQEKMIYQLKKDNKKLLDMLQKFNMNQFIKQPQITLNQNITVNQQTGSDMSLTMQTMISDIYSKLQRITQGFKYNSNTSSQKQFGGISPQKSRRSQQSPTKKNKKKVDYIDQQNNTNYKISSDLQILKVYIVDLSSTCEKLVKKLQIEQNTRNYTTKKQYSVIEQQRKINQIIPKDAELIQFYKDKNKQLQNRVNQLLNLSNLLKQKLSQKHLEQNSGEDYWKNQIKSIKSQCQQIRSRYQKLLIQYQQSQDKRQQFQTKVALYSMQIQRLNQFKKDYQQLSIKIQSFQKQIEQSNRIKNNMQRQLTICTHKSQQITIKLEQYTKIILNKDKQIKQLNIKIQELNRNKYTLQNDYKDNISKNQQILRNYNRLQVQIQEIRKIDNFKIRYEELQRKYQMIVVKYNGEIEVQIKNNRVLLTQIQQIKRQILLREQQNKQLKLQITQLNNKTTTQTQQTTLTKLPLSYLYILQKLRSRILECEVLTGELLIQNSTRNQQIRNSLSLAINEQLIIVSQITSLLQSFNLNSNSTSSQLQKQLRIKIENLQRKIKINIESNTFKLQFLRSLLIELSTLLQQLNIIEQRDKQILQTLKSQINKGFQTIATFDLF